MFVILLNNFMVFMITNSIPVLDQIHCRNAHIIYSSQEDYVETNQHPKKIALLNVDRKGRLYHVGKLEFVWITFVNYLMRGRSHKEIQAKVFKTIDTTIEAINQHLNRLNECWKTSQQQDSVDIETISNQLYIYPRNSDSNQSNNSIVRKEPLFLLDVTTIAQYCFKISESSSICEVPQELKNKIVQLQEIYYRLEKELIEKDPSLDILEKLKQEKYVGLSLKIVQKRTQLADSALKKIILQRRLGSPSNLLFKNS